jgi:Flp pilus assembly protein TadG
MTERGSVAIELGLLIPVVLVLLGIVAETAAIAQVQVLLVHASREGARAAAVAPDVAEAVAAVERSLPAPIADRASISVERSRGVGQPVRVTVRAVHRLFRFVGGIPVTLGWSATMRSER